MSMHALLSTKLAPISSSVRILPSPSNKHVEDSKSSNTKEKSFVPWYGLTETLKSIFSLQETNLRFCHLKLQRVTKPEEEPIKLTVGYSNLEDLKYWNPF
jgi:hypothetical protein